MGYSKDIFRLLSLLDKILDWKNQSIIEYGSQEIDVGLNYVYDFIYSHRKNKVELDIRDYINKNTKISTKFIYESLGIKQYDCIDINGEHNCLSFDLNYNLKEKYGFSKKYTIVTNFGTTEHIINQLTCFENMHNLCKIGGIIIINLPIRGGENHGFFNYHPTFFEHLANANRYDILYLKYQNSSYYSSLDTTNITVVFKKNYDDDFNVPIQKWINKTTNEVNLLEENYILKQFYLLTQIDLNKIKNIAIFGTAQAGAEAFEFCKRFDKKVVCFIDDFKIGKYQDTDIPIISYQDFLRNYQDEIDLILIGNYQKGEIYKRKGLEKRVVMLSNLIYDI